MTSSSQIDDKGSHSSLAPAESVHQPLRVLHIISDLSLAGAEMLLYKLLASTDRKRFAPTVISMKNRGALRERVRSLGIPVYTLGIRGPLPGPVAIARLVRIVRRVQPQLIHGWMYHGHLAAQFAALFVREKPPLVWSIHQSLPSFAFEKLVTAAIIKFGARTSHRPEKIVYVSKASASEHEAIGYKRDKTLVVHQGFDTEGFAPSLEARHSVREELNLPENAILVGLIGRYHLVKDQANFLRATVILSKRHPDAHFLLCGNGVDTNTSLRAQVAQDELGRRVHLRGERRDIQRITAALDIAVSSSFSEGFPNVIGEAMSSGVPCVVTEISDLSEIIGSTGRLVPPRNSNALAAAIEEMIVIGSQGRSKLGAAARARIIERYSLGTFVANFQTVYENIVTEARDGNGHDLLVSRAVGRNG